MEKENKVEIIKKVSYQIFYLDDENRKHRTTTENPSLLKFIEDRYTILEHKVIERDYDQQENTVKTSY